MDLLAFSVFSCQNMGLIYEGIKYKSTKFFLKKNMVKHIILLFTLYICVVDIYILPSWHSSMSCLPFKFILQINVMFYTITSINSFLVNNNKKALKKIFKKFIALFFI